MKKRILSMLLIIVMVASFIPVMASAATPTIGARTETNTNGDVFLGGNYIEVGISKGGSFGTSSMPKTSGWHGKSGLSGIGLLSDGDGWDVGNAPTTGDFFLPGTPEERWILAYKIDGTTYEYHVADRIGNSGSWKTAPKTVDHSNIASGSLKAVVTGITTHDVKVEITYSFGVDDKYYNTAVKISNEGSEDITDVRFIRSFDPDQDQQISGSYATYNKVVCNPDSSRPGSETNFAMVVARGDSTLSGFFFLAFDNRARASINTDLGLRPANAYVSFLYDRAPTTALTFATEDTVAMTKSNTNGYSLRDTSIALTFSLGEMEAGATDNLEFLSSLDPDVAGSLNTILKGAIDYQNETIKGLEAGKTYWITCNGVTYIFESIPSDEIPLSGTAPVSGGSNTAYSFFGKTITIVEKDALGNDASVSQDITITSKPDTEVPEMDSTGSSSVIPNEIITTSSSITIKAASDQEYSIDNGTTWVRANASGNVVFSGLEIGEYKILTRKYATDSHFASTAKEFTVKVAKNVYTITVSTDEALAGTYTGAGSYEEGATVILTATPNTGYKFVKWVEGTTTVSTSATYTFSATSDRTVKAVFDTKNFTIKYNANGGSGSMSNQTMQVGIAEKLTKNTFTKSYSVFKGWNTKANGSGTSYPDEQSFTGTTEGEVITLYAMWEDEYKDYVILSDDLAHVQSVLDGIATVTKGSDNIVRIKFTTDLVKGRIAYGTSSTSYNMQGTFIMDLNGTTIDPGDRLEALCLDNGFNGTVTLTGEGTLKKGLNHSIYQYKGNALKFDVAEGKEYFSLKVDSSYKFDEKNITVKSNSGNIDGTTIILSQGMLETYTVKYNSNGGTGSMPNQTIKEVIETKLSKNTFERVGYIFKGWAKTSGGSKEISDEATVKDLTTKGNTITLYAVWEKIPAVAPTVSITPEGYEGVNALTFGSILGKQLSVVSDADETVYNVSYEWYKNTVNSKSGATLAPNGSAKNITLEENLSAKDYYYYCKITVTRKDNGDSKSVETNLVKVTVNKMTVAAPIALNKTDETIKGKQDGSITGVDSYMEYKLISDSLYTHITGTELTSLPSGIYFVRYKETENSFASDDVTVEILPGRFINVTFVTNGGTLVSNQELSYNETITCPAEPVKDGYEFVAWYTEDTLENKFDFSTMVTDDKTLYIKWVKGVVANDSFVNLGVEANGLNNVAKEKEDSITLSLTKEEYQDLPVYNELKQAAEGYLFFEYYDLTLTNDRTALAITDASNVVEIKLPYDYTRKIKVGVLRNNGGIDTFTQLEEKPVSSYTDATYFLDSENGYIYIYTAEFSKIAIPFNYRSSSGSNEVYTYKVTFVTDGGTEIAPVTVKRGEKVKQPEDPVKEGYEFVGWKSDADLKFSFDFNYGISTNTYVYAKWEEAKDHICPSKAFNDLDTTMWYHEDTDYVISNELMKGTDATTFSPNTDLTRAMLVTVLYRLEGSPAVNRSIPFSDIDMGDYYASAVIWAQQNGIVKGISDTEFAPNVKITREQIAAIMHRFAQYKGYDVSVGEDTNILSYEDFNDISEYAIPAMQWAVGSGLMKGRTDSTLNPKENATRVEIAAVLHRFIEANK